MLEIDIARTNHLIDPQLHLWGWEIPVYLFLGGITAGIMIFSALLSRQYPPERRSAWSRWLPFAAPVVLSGGMLALFLDLEYRLHVYRFYLAFQATSPMSWGSWILLGIYPASLALGLACLREEEARWFGAPVARLRAWLGEHLGILQWANLALGAGLGIYTGILLSGLGVARPVWNSAMLGPLFLVSGLSTGAALMMLFPLNHEEHTSLRRWDLLAIGVEALLLFLFLASLVTGGGQAGREAASLVLGGAYTAPFWTLVVIVGLVLPFVIKSLEGTRGLPPTRLAPVLVLIGGFSLRWILVLAGQSL